MSSFRNGGLARSFSPETLTVVGRDFDGLFDQLFGAGTGDATQRNGGSAASTGRTLRAPIHVWEKGDKLFVSLDLPGVSKEAISVTFENGMLSVEAERKGPELGEHKSWHNNLSFGVYKHRIAIGDAFDPNSIEAAYTDGVLNVQVSKRPEVQPRKVEIK